MRLAQAIIATLTYSDHFNYPLTLSELSERLIKCRAQKNEVMSELTKLINLGQVEKTGSYFCLAGRKSLSKIRTERHRVTQVKVKRARQSARLIQKVPGVLAVYLTGSLAVDNASEHDDIDLMIVARSGRLWMTRFLVTLLVELTGIRRHPQVHSAKDQVCLNLYLTPSAFTLRPARRSLYTAYELIQAVPLQDPSDTRAHLVRANAWIKTWLPNVRLPKVVRPLPQEKRSWFLARLEKLAYTSQYRYMRSKITKEYIAPDAAFFHPSSPVTKLPQKMKAVE